jgi:hypothetical protein
VSAYLPEILEGEAAGTLAQTYDDIRTILAVPVVNLIYRHLAVEPGRLESIWAELRPNLAHPATHVLATELARSADRVRPPVVAIDPQDFVRTGVSVDDLRRAQATLAVYERANALNLLAVSALISGTRGTEDTGAQASPAGVHANEILPMAELSSLDGPTRKILAKLSLAVAPPGDETLVPSLYRHLASNPALLELILTHVGHKLCASQLSSAAEIVRSEATALASRLPCHVDAEPDPDVRSVLERFAPLMAEMLVAGRTISQALEAGA